MQAYMSVCMCGTSACRYVCVHVCAFTYMPVGMPVCVRKSCAEDLLGYERVVEQGVPSFLNLFEGEATGKLDPCVHCLEVIGLSTNVIPLTSNKHVSQERSFQCLITSGCFFISSFFNPLCLRAFENVLKKHCASAANVRERTNSTWPI